MNTRASTFITPGPSHVRSYLSPSRPLNDPIPVRSLHLPPPVPTAHVIPVPAPPVPAPPVPNYQDMYISELRAQLATLSTREVE